MDTSDNSFRVVGLYAPASGSGKTTAATYIKGAFGFTPVSFASPLKSLALRLLLQFYTGEGGELAGYEWASQFFRAKDLPIRELPGTPTMRAVLEAIGDDVRETLHQDFWVEAARISVERRRASGARGVVFDDVRYPNEAEFIRGLGGLLLQITRPGAKRAVGAKAEGLLDGYSFDATFMNVGSKGDLFNLVAAKLAALFDQGLPSAHRPE